MNGLPDTKLFVALAEIGIVSQTIPQMGNAIFSSKPEDRKQTDFSQGLSYFEDNLTRLANSAQYALAQLNSLKEEIAKQPSENIPKDDIANM